MQNTVDQVISKTLTSIVTFPWLYLKMTGRLLSFLNLRYPFPAGEQHLHPVTYFAVSVFLLYLALRQALHADGYVLANSLTPDSLFTQLTAAKIIASTLIAVFLSHLLAWLFHAFYSSFGTPDYQPPYRETSAVIHYSLGLQTLVLATALHLEVWVPGFDLPLSLVIWLPVIAFLVIINFQTFEWLDSFYKSDIYEAFLRILRRSGQKPKRTRFEPLIKIFVSNGQYNLQNSIAMLAMGSVVAGTFFAIFLLEQAAKPKKPPLALVSENSNFGYTQAAYIFTNNTSRKLTVRRSDTLFAIGYLTPDRVMPEIAYRSPFWSREDPEVFTIGPGETHVFDLQLDLFYRQEEKIPETPIHIVLGLSVLSGSDWELLTTETATLNPSTTREEL